MSKTIAIWLIAFIWLPLSVQAAEIPVVELDEDADVVLAAGNFVYCIQESAETCSNEDYRLVDSDVISEGFITGQLVLLSRLVNTTDLEKDLKIEIGNPSLNNVLVEVFSDDEWLYIDEFSDLRCFDERNFFHRNFILPFTMNPFEEVVVRITIGVQRESIFLPVRICTEKYFNQTSVVDFLLLGSLIGMYTIYIIFILGLFLLWRSRLFSLLCPH